MILVVGSIASGKTTYVKSLGYDDSQIIDFADDVFDGASNAAAPVVRGVEHAVRAALEKEESLDDLLAWLFEREVVVCTEVGSGIIPVNPMEVAVREQSGRLNVLLARRATRVVRLVCGIPVVLKAE